MFARTITILATLLAAPTAMAAADLQTTTSVNISPALTYSTARYTVSVKKIGNQHAQGCTVRINLPPTHTSPQVYVLGILGAKSASCTQTGTRLDCTLGQINKNATKSVWFDIALPVSSAPYVFTAVSATTSNETNFMNNTATRTAQETYYATTVATSPGVPVTMRNRHCTGIGLTAFYECTLFASSITFHDVLFHDDGTITIPGYAGFTGGWTVTPTAVGNFLEFFYDDGTGVVAEFEGWGADALCFEGITTFPGSSYLSPYEVCPL